jgi:recombination protein RecT
MTKQQSTAIVVDAKQAYGDISEYLLGKQKAIANIAPKYLDTERMIRLALGASSRRPQLLQCSPKSWMAALMDCAYYGIEPNEQLGHAYLVPYMNNKVRQLEVQFQIGYKGYLLLAKEHADLVVSTEIVYQAEIDQRRFRRTPDDPGRPFKYDPIEDEEARGEPGGAYAAGRRPGATDWDYFTYLRKAEIEGYRGRSRAANNGPWVTDWEAMAKKTAIRRMMSNVPLKPGSRLGAALAQDETLEREGEVIRAQDWQVEDGRSVTSGSSSKADRLAVELAEKAKTASDSSPSVIQAAEEPVATEAQQDLFVP